MPHTAPPGAPGGVPDEAWSPRAAETTAGPPPIALPGYRDFVLVASGGDSLVFRAVQEGVNRPVAVKVLVGEADGAPAARYQRELEITVRLGRAHPNIVTVLDTQILPDGRPCIVMEYHELGSLHDQLRAHGPLPSSAVVAAGTVVADALTYAHGEGVLHRDVKPQNILVLPTSYVLADFGLARRIDAGHTASLERFSYRHASPQVLDGELPTVADDIYSLGSTLFTLLDGRPPFAVDESESDSALAYLRRARSEPPRPIRSSDATPELLAIVERCLAKRREDRFPDAAALRDALRSVVTEARVWARTWQPRLIPGRASPSATSESPPADAATRHWTAEQPAILEPPAPAEPPVPPVAGPVTAPQPVIGVDEAPPPVRPRWTDELRHDGDDDSDGLGHPAPAAPSRSRWSRIALLTLLALVLGTGVGVGASWVATQVTAREGPVQTVPSYTGSLPSDTTSMVLDPALAPRITALDDAGTSVEIVWDDPTGGRVRFVIVRIEGAVPLLTVDAGTTRARVTGLDPAQDYCFSVLAIAVDNSATGVSDPRCTER